MTFESLLLSMSRVVKYPLSSPLCDKELPWGVDQLQTSAAPVSLNTGTSV